MAIMHIIIYFYFCMIHLTLEATSYTIKPSTGLSVKCNIIGFGELYLIKSHVQNQKISQNWVSTLKIAIPCQSQDNTCQIMFFLKIKLYMTVITPVLRYGVVCWTVRKKEEQILEKTEMRMLRRIKGVETE